MVFDVGPTSREGLTETEMLSGSTKTFDDVQNGPIKNKNLGKLKRIMIVDDEEDVTFLFKVILEGKSPLLFLVHFILIISCAHLSGGIINFLFLVMVTFELKKRM
jgi:hypothetical protein